MRSKYAEVIGEAMDKNNENEKELNKQRSELKTNYLNGKQKYWFLMLNCLMQCRHSYSPFGLFVVCHLHSTPSRPMCNNNTIFLFLDEKNISQFQNETNIYV